MFYLLLFVLLSFSSNALAADQKISARSAASTLDGTETIPVIQGGNDRKTTLGAQFASSTLTCTNQVLRLLSTSLTGTCVTITSAYADGSIAKVGTANSWTAGIKQTFAPNATNSGFNVGSVAAAPSSPVNGDIYYDSFLTAFQFYQNGGWVGTGVQTEAQGLQDVFAISKSVTGANSLANAVRIGDGVTPLCAYTDATLGPQVRPCTDANVLTVIPANFTWDLWDIEGSVSMLKADPDAFGTGSGTLTVQTSEQLIASNFGVEFNESDTNPACASGNYNIYADTSEAKLKKCQNGVVTDLGSTTIVRKISDETVNNSASLQNDDELLFVVAANSYYIFDAFIVYSSATAADFNIAFTAPASTTGTITYWYPLNTASVCSGTAGSNFNFYSNTLTQANNGVGGIGVGSNCTLLIKAVVVTAGSAGNVQLQWAQATANASNTVVNAGSYIVWSKY